MNQFRGDMWFSYAGLRSRDKGIAMVTVGDSGDEAIFGLNRTMETTEGLTNEYIFKEMKYEKVTIPITLTKINNNGSIGELNPDELNFISRWLLRTEPTPLSTEYGLTYYGAFTGEQKYWVNGNNEGYLRVNFELSDPFAYSSIIINNKIVNGSSIIELPNKSNCNMDSLPVIEMNLLGDTTDVKIENLNTGEFTEFKGLDKLENIIIESKNMQIYSNKNINSKVFELSNKKFIKLIYGKNKIRVTSNGKLSIKIQYQVQLALQ